jgi:hypothetical protein
MEIGNYRELNQGAVVAEFSALGNGIYFHRMKLMRSRKGHLFLTYPSYRESKDDPNSKWIPFVEMSAEKKADFEKKVFEALKPFVKDL